MAGPTCLTPCESTSFFVCVVCVYVLVLSSLQNGGKPSKGSGTSGLTFPLTKGFRESNLSCVGVKEGSSIDPQGVDC